VRSSLTKEIMHTTQEQLGQTVLRAVLKYRSSILWEGILDLDSSV